MTYNTLFGWPHRWSFVMQTRRFGWLKIPSLSTQERPWSKWWLSWRWCLPTLHSDSEQCWTSRMTRPGGWLVMSGSLKDLVSMLFLWIVCGSVIRIICWTERSDNGAFWRSNNGAFWRTWLALQVYELLCSIPALYICWGTTSMPAWITRDTKDLRGFYWKSDCMRWP